MAATKDIIIANYEHGHHLSADFAERECVGKVSVIMGSRTDWPFMKPCTDVLEELGIEFEYGVVSAHRTPKRMALYSEKAFWRGIEVIIACAGGSAHLPGMVASETLVPVLGVSPKKTDHFAVDSMIAMPAGKPLAYLGGGSDEYRNAGAENAALFAARQLALHDPALAGRLKEYDDKLRDGVPLTCHD